MRIALVYFSGTGNTRKCLEFLSDVLVDKGNETILFDLEKKRDFDLSSFDILVLGYPIHAFNAPRILLDFAFSLTGFPKENPIYVVKTSGEGLPLNDYSSSYLQTILSRKGYCLYGEFHYLMPYNLVFRHTEDMAYKMWETAKKLIPLDAERIQNRERNNYHANMPTRMALALLRIEQKGSGLLGRTFHVDSHCIRCGQCVRSCPVHNITMDEKGIHFGSVCLLCSRCAFNCPKDAIHLGPLNFMKVNGPYRFEKTGDGEKNGKILSKSYEHYFREAEERIRKEDGK